MSICRNDEAMATPSDAISIALAHHVAGRLDEAERLYRHILATDPDSFNAWHLLGLTALQAGKTDVALHAIGRAVELNPGLAQAHYHLGNAQSASGHSEEAIACYRQALQLKPDFAEAHANLGLALQARGQLEEASAHVQHAIELKPDFAVAHNSLGTVYHQQGRFDEAIDRYSRAIEIEPTFAEAGANLGAAYNEQGRFDEAVAVLQRAIAENPDLAEAYNNLGNAYKEQGRPDEAIASFRQAVGRKSSYAAAHSNLLYTLYFCPGLSAAAIYQEHLRWNEAYARSLSPAVPGYVNNRDPARRLKVGFVSRDFREHCQSFFTTPLFRFHDREQFAFICYSDVFRPDATTAQLRACTHRWQDISKLSDKQVAELIRRDEIDLLVDLTMHMAHGRPLLFAQKPAPVQTCWLAYPGTTGLTTIDYRLTDPFLDPAGVDDPCYSERSIRLPDSFWCYDPLATLPEVNSLPASRNGYITFGSLNSFSKVNPAVIRLWAAVLKAIDGSRLTLLAPEGTCRQRLLALAKGEGVASDRITFTNYRPRPEYLAAYHNIDIGLDPFPANGHTTSLDSCWMGVPMITLAGQTAIGRGGVSILRNLGLPELIARTQEQYVQIAAQLAADLDRLNDLRNNLREQMRRSPLMDAARFARNIEAAFRAMWHQWCTGEAKD